MKRSLPYIAAFAAFCFAMGAIYIKGLPEAPVASRSVGVEESIKVDKLFTNEGCTMYRFFDANAYRYYRSCDVKTRGGDTSGGDD